jgi:DNA-binding LytR/AlgR family response regulator
MKLSCIIVDDEPTSRLFLRKFCERAGSYEIAGQFDNAQDAITHLQNNQADVIFLDVEMPGINGFEMLEKIERKPQVIMITSKTDYAFTAFEYNVTDFLKKPVDYTRFLKTTELLLKAKAQKSAAPSSTTDFFIKTDGDLVRIKSDDVLYIEGMGDYVKYVTPEKKYITLSTLKSVEEKISDSIFMKVHRSYIVNTQKIKSFTDNQISIHNIFIPVSKAHKATLLQQLSR